MSDGPKSVHYDLRGDGLPGLKMEEKFKLDSMVVTCVAEGPYKAVQITRENVELLARWCDGEVMREHALDAPEAFYYIAIPTCDRKLRPFTERAEPGDWIVRSAVEVGYFKVYSDGAFRNLYDLTPKATQSPDDFRRAAGITVEYEDVVKDKHDEIQSRTTEMVLNAMEYQDDIARRGGHLDEGFPVAEFVGLSVRRMIEL